MKKTIILFVYFSFLLILLGGVATHFTSKKGMILLRAHEQVNYFFDEGSDTPVILPFAIWLDEFTIEYYPGTLSPADYISKVRFSDSPESVRQISMNKIVSHHHYRFYQNSFGRDGESSRLAVYYDPWGITITYTGYLLFFISMLLLMISPKERFRKLLKSPFLKRVTVIFLCLISFIHTSYSTNTLPKEEALQFEDVLILHHGRIVPFNTFAKEFTLKLTGKPVYQGYSPEQVALGWFFYPEKWQHEPMFKVKSKVVQQTIPCGKMARFSDFFDQEGNYKIADLWGKSMTNSYITPFQKDLLAIDEKVEVIDMLQTTTSLKIFPVSVAETIQWFSSVDSLPSSLPESQQLFIRHFFTLLHHAVQSDHAEDIRLLIKGLKTYQGREGGESVPPRSKIKAEILYNRIQFTTILYRINLSLGLLSIFLSLFFFLKRIKYSEIIHKALFILMLLIFLFYLFGFLLRSYISGRFPLSNGFETMFFISGCIMLIAILWQYRLPVLLYSGFLLSGLTFLVADIGFSNPQITPLVPVLNSPILNIHVSVIMIAYSLFALIFLNAVFALISFQINRRHNRFTAVKRVMTFTVLNRILLYPAVFLLGTGICVGAVWANISWGSYWSWDPKETWALITFLVYGLALHEKIPVFKKPVSFHLYLLFAIISVLMTYFGVNYFFGGMHSYVN